MRMSALASALRDAGACVSFACKSCPKLLLARFERSGCEIVEISELASREQEIATIAEADFIVLDGYHFDSAYQDNLKAQTSAKLLIVDDTAHLPTYNCDLLLNQNAYFPQAAYTDKTSAKLLLGLDYVLLRGEFRAQKPRTTHNESKAGLRLLITMGGSDAENVTGLAVQAATANKYEFTVILGTASPNKDLVEAQLQGLTQAKLIVSPENMAPLLAEHDLIISAGGTTVWEAAYLGIPNIVIITADNQSGVERFAAKGACINLGWHKTVTVERLSQEISSLMQDSARREALTTMATSLVDGQGAGRAARALLELKGP